MYTLADIQLWYAIRMADNAHAKYGDRFFVMPNEKDKLIVINRKSFRSYKKKGMISLDARVLHMIKESFYYTPTRDEKTDLTSEIKAAKRLMWLKYYFNK